ncbi:unnamed protein product, partial [Staurois parvus]
IVLALLPVSFSTRLPTTLSQSHYKSLITTITMTHGWTDNSWGPRAIGDHGAPVSLPTLKNAYEKGY